MGDKLVTAQSPKIEYYTCAEIFEKCCGFYLSIGMSYADYWDGDCEMVKFYRNKNKCSFERKNQELWLLGGYIYSAILNVSPVLNPFSKKHEPFPYMEKPVELFHIEETPEEKTHKELNENREKMIKLAEQFNSGFRKRQQKEQEQKKEVKHHA